MASSELDDLTTILPALLGSLEALGFIARHFHPPHLAAVMDAAGAPDATLGSALARLDSWPSSLADVSGALKSSATTVLAAFAGLRAARHERDTLRAAYRALRRLPLALEALYPLAAEIAPVGRFFLAPELRNDAELKGRLANRSPDEDVGVFHFANQPGARGGYSVYVPEWRRSDDDWPLVVALHGGGGHGRGFLWSWLRDARGLGAILVAPTAIGDTWALMGKDEDTANLNRILSDVRARWRIDSSRLLLTGMSDGGTFSYVSGLEGQSPFTHLAPISAAFHPLLAQMAEPGRIAGLPVFVSHGALDWMFPVESGRAASKALTAAGARVTYREIADLSHAYPREMNPVLLRWLNRERPR